MNYLLFVGDLHLSAERPDIITTFHRFLDEHMGQCEGLYILGDLFETWMGDDIAPLFALELAAKLKQFSRHSPIYFIHGNRDFLVGQQYANLAGMTLLPEVYCIDIYGQKTVLLHGDSLCTLDKNYQYLRQFRNQNWARFCYRQLPKKWRIGIANKLRRQSKTSNQYKNDVILDVSAAAVTELMNETSAQLMIHGHTHRPNIHKLHDNKQRIVVGDWYEQGSVLKINRDKLDLEVIALPSN